MPQVLSDGVGISVDQLGGERKLVEGLIPELALRLGGEHTMAGAGQRGREDKGLHQIRMHPGHALRDAAADVVTGDDDIGQAQFLDQSDDAVGLGGRAVEVTDRHLVFVRPAETAQIGNDDVGDLAEYGNDPAVVMPVSGPSVQQHDGRRTPGPEAVEGQSKPVHGRAARPHWPILAISQPDRCNVSESPVMTARMARHESDGQLSRSLCARGPVINRPSS
jgi:hypothetical protein